MARRPITDMSAWPSLSLEGNLIAPAMIAKIDRREADRQDGADYGVRKGLTVREEISLAFRVGQAHFDAFAKIQSPSVEATRRFMSEFLKETFGFSDLSDGSGIVASISGGRVPVVIVPPSEVLDRKSPTPFDRPIALPFDCAAGLPERTRRSALGTCYKWNSITFDARQRVAHPTRTYRG